MTDFQTGAQFVPGERDRHPGQRRQPYFGEGEWFLIRDRCPDSRSVLQYYDDTYPSAKEQKVFEKNLFGKTHRENGEIIMLDGFTIVYRSSVDLFFYVMGSANENGVRSFF